MQGLREQPLQPRFECHDFQVLTGREDLLDNRATEGNAHQHRQFGRILRTRRVFRQRFDDGAHVADIDTLFKQVLQDALHGG